jgi:hypothetical protein
MDRLTLACLAIMTFCAALVIAACVAIVTA